MLIKRPLFMAVLIFSFCLAVASCSKPAADTETPVFDVSPQATESEYAPVELYILKREDYLTAVCVDGSPGGFGFRRGYDEGANKWALVLEGGGWCDSREDCEKRNKRLVSTYHWRRKPSEEIVGFLDGIFNPDPAYNPHFYNWNQVFFFYCSGDTWEGQRLASPETKGVNWAGHFILEAIIDTLEDSTVIGSPSLTSAEEIIFIGSSAGAGGIRSNLDWVAEKLRSDQIDAKFKGVMDSGVGPLSPPEGSPWNPDPHLDLWEAFVDQDCLADHEESGDAWKCRSTEYILANGYISTPLFVYHDQSDPTLEMSYGAEIQSRILNIIPFQPNAFSPNQGNHLLIIVPQFYSMRLEYPTEFIAGYENGLMLEDGVSYSFSDLLWLWFSQ